MGSLHAGWVEAAALAWLGAAALWDWRRREVPDVFALGLVALAIGATAGGVGSVTWLGLGVGAAIGLALGTLGFALGAIGGGDAKLLAALGALLGPAGLFGALVYATLAGGALALAGWWRGAREVAYVPALALGLAVYAGRHGAWSHALGG